MTDTLTIQDLEGSLDVLAELIQLYGVEQYGQFYAAVEQELDTRLKKQSVLDSALARYQNMKAKSSTQISTQISTQN